MNREIKFRAYQPHASLHRRPGMYQVNDIVWYKEGWPSREDPDTIYTGEVFFDHEGMNSSEFLEDIHLMQYTGLKDKNNKEIYEGDIVKEYTISRNQVVFWSPEHAAFKLGARGVDTQYDKRNSFWHDQCEVIGNIHENPELLK